MLLVPGLHFVNGKSKYLSKTDFIYVHFFFFLAWDEPKHLSDQNIWVKKFVSSEKRWALKDDQEVL